MIFDQEDGLGTELTHPPPVRKPELEQQMSTLLAESSRRYQEKIQAEKHEFEADPEAYARKHKQLMLQSMRAQIQDLKAQQGEKQQLINSPTMEGQDEKEKALQTIKVQQNDEQEKRREEMIRKRHEMMEKAMAQPYRGSRQEFNQAEEERVQRMKAQQRMGQEREGINQQQLMREMQQIQAQLMSQLSEEEAAIHSSIRQSSRRRQPLSPQQVAFLKSVQIKQQEKISARPGLKEKIDQIQQQRKRSIQQMQRMRNQHQRQGESDQRQKLAGHHDHSNCSHGHNHGHNHGQGQHGHGHSQHGQGHGQGQQAHRHSLKQTNRIDGIIVFVLVTIVNTMILNYNWLFQTSANQFERWFNKLLLLYYGVLIPWAYYHCIFTKNNPEVLPVRPNYPEDCVDPAFLKNQPCLVCASIKPARTSHCSQCGACQMRFDHHCMWSNNCIGLRNRQPFICFISYMSLGSLHYLFNSYRWLFRSQLTLSFNVKLYWTVNTVCMTPFAIMLMLLCVSHFVFLATNQTTIEIIKGAQFQVPFCQFRENFKGHVSDHGFIRNIKDTLGGYFRFWYPHVNEPRAPLEHDDLGPEPKQFDIVRLQMDSALLREQEMKTLMESARRKLKGTVIKLKGCDYIV